jgi:hypothetical protein
MITTIITIAAAKAVASPMIAAACARPVAICASRYSVLAHGTGMERRPHPRRESG